MSNIAGGFGRPTASLEGSVHCPGMQPGFFDIDRPTEPARVGLEQVTDSHFALLAGFTYRGPDGSVHHVFSWNLPCSDLASIPRSFRWFEGRHGRHTLAALLHDHQVDPGPDDPRTPRYWRRRTLADDRFAESMGVLGVPDVRRLLMWSAVHFKTRLVDHGAGARAAMVVWSLLSLVGGYVVAARLLAAWPGWDLPLSEPAWLAPVAAAAPLVAPLLWVPWTQVAAYGDIGRWTMLTRRWGCGIVMGYGVLLMLPTGLVVAAAEGIRSIADIGGWGPSPWVDPDGCGD